jgi:outer membrane biogenesis lipoprotein LolB
MKINLILIIVFSTLLLTACTDDEGKDASNTRRDHVWKDQTDTIDKAKEVEGMLKDSADLQRKMIEDQVQ